MKILNVNKFLYPKGGSEEYMFQLAALLEEHNFQCSFWGMADEKNIVSDEYKCFADSIDYQTLKGTKKLGAAVNTIYSASNAKKIGIVLDAFKPEIVHLHNYNFQLTPSILPEINRRGIKIIHTAHDSQLACPYHRFYNFRKQEICTECCIGKFHRCVVNRCFDGSFFKSTIGAVESYLYHGLDYYNKYLDAIISPSEFLATYLRKSVRVPIHVIPNFTREYSLPQTPSGDYVLYFGRISEEKGILDIQNLSVWNRHRLIIVGQGPDISQLRPSEQIKYLGPKYGHELRTCIANARYVIQPSKWYENCPMTVIESLMCGTPVIASNKGGFTDMIEHGVNGFLIDFQKDIDGEDLEGALKTNPALMRDHCRKSYLKHYTPDVHIHQIMNVYRSVLA